MKSEDVGRRSRSLLSEHSLNLIGVFFKSISTYNKAEEPSFSNKEFILRELSEETYRSESF